MTDTWRTEPSGDSERGAPAAAVAPVEPAPVSVPTPVQSAAEPAASEPATEVGVAEVHPRPDLVQVSRATRWAMIGFFLFFGTLVGLANTTKYHPLQGLRLATKFGMFSAPPRSQPIVVRGIPRRGREPEVLVDPNKPSDSWLTRLRDARERKWHDNVARASGLQQNYLAYRCRMHGADYRKVQLFAVADLDMGEKVIQERNCPLPQFDKSRAPR